jgi:alkanesulfonate monooxygenase SsuD/methylene tetrahydromethanopterin reductase-like flavin-dependent oxidoreductase (luciferase family)
VETLEILRNGLMNEYLDHRGEHFRYRHVPMALRPVQSPVPFWCAAAAPESQVYAAQAGMNIVSLGSVERVRTITAFYKEAWAEQRGHPLRRFAASDEPLIGAYRLVFVADTDAEAERHARRAYQDWFEKLAKLWREHGVDTYFLTLERYETAREQGMLLAGSPSRVQDELAAQIETCGFNYCLLQMAFGDLGHALEMRSLALLAEQVMPALRSL